MAAWEPFSKEMSDKIDKMIEWCHEGSPMSRVDRVEVLEEVYTGDFDRFTISSLRGGTVKELLNNFYDFLAQHDFPTLLESLFASLNGTMWPEAVIPGLSSCRF